MPLEANRKSRTAMMFRLIAIVTAIPLAYFALVAAHEKDAWNMAGAGAGLLLSVVWAILSVSYELADWRSDAP